MIKASHDNSDPRWTAGCSGEITSLVKRMHAQRRTRLAMRVGGIASLFVAVGLVGWMGASTLISRDGPRALMTCIDVHNLAEQFVLGALDTLTTKDIDDHLVHCKRCRDYIATLRPGIALPPVNSVLPPANSDAFVPAAESSPVDFVLAVNSRSSR